MRRRALVYLFVLQAGTSTGCNDAAPSRDQDPAPAASTIVAADEGFVPLTDGARLYYRRVGDGSDPVILTPGLFLAPDLDRLAPGRTLIFLDPRNRGRSDPVADSSLLTIQQEVRDLETVRRHFGFDRVALVGYSYAGLLVILYALEHPDHVIRIVQLGPVPRRYGTEYPPELTAEDPPEVAPLRAELQRLREAGLDRSNPREFCERSWELSRLRLVGNPANAHLLGPSKCDLPNELPSNFARQLRFHFGSVQRLDVPLERLATLALPVLTVHGDLDRNAPYGAGREWATTLPQARLLTIPGAAHQSWAEFPDLVLPALDTFLKGTWPPTAEVLRR